MTIRPRRQALLKYFAATVLALMLSLGISSPITAQPIQTAQTFTAPAYVPGTMFTLRIVQANGYTRLRKLTFKKTNHIPSQRYDFKRYVLSSTLVLARKKRINADTDRWRIIQKKRGIRFPFSLGDTCNYTYSFKKTKPIDCAFTRSFNVTVAPSMHKVTVDGTTLDVVDVHHEGTWACRKLKGGRYTIDYAYSPRLGMFVSQTWKKFKHEGKIIEQGEKRLVKFTVPSK